MCTKGDVQQACIAFQILLFSFQQIPNNTFPLTQGSVPDLGHLTQMPPSQPHCSAPGVREANSYPLRNSSSCIGEFWSVCTGRVIGHKLGGEASSVLFLSGAYMALAPPGQKSHGSTSLQVTPPLGFSHRLTFVSPSGDSYQPPAVDVLQVSSAFPSITYATNVMRSILSV